MPDKTDTQATPPMLLESWGLFSKQQYSKCTCQSIQLVWSRDARTLSNAKKKKKQPTIFLPLSVHPTHPCPSWLIFYSSDNVGVKVGGGWGGMSAGSCPCSSSLLVFFVCFSRGPAILPCTSVWRGMCAQGVTSLCGFCVTCFSNQLSDCRVGS